MNKNRYGPYSLGVIVILTSTIMTPAFAEVTSLQTNSDSYYIGDQIKFSGTVEQGSSGLVTIVIRDLNDKFVILTQALINYDYSFQKTVKINERFTEDGIYNATGFILNMTQGVTTNFGVSTNGIPVILNEKEIETPIIIATKINEESNVEEIVEESQIESVEKTPKIADFVDINKDPQHYIDRYYNEKSYKSWFDRNYPNITIEEAVGYTNNVNEIKSKVRKIIDKEIIPEAQATSFVEPTQQPSDNPETAQIILAIAGLGILFGAVYGIKRQVDNNSKQISINKETLRRKFIQPIIGTNPKEILQTRLAKGEITPEEYDKIKSKLD